MKSRKTLRTRIVVRLRKAEKVELRALTRRGELNVRVVKRARVLELMDEGKTAPKAGAAVGITAQAARGIAKRYSEGGLDRALFDAPRPGAKPLLDKKQSSRIVAMVCSRPPEGFSRWSLRLIAREASRRGIVESLSIEPIRSLLKRHDLKPWREKNVVCS